MSPVINWPARQPCPCCGRATRVDPQLDVDIMDVEPTACADCGAWIWPGSWLWRMSEGSGSTGGMPAWAEQLVRAEMAKPATLVWWEPDTKTLVQRTYDRSWGTALRVVALLLRDI